MYPYWWQESIVAKDILGLGISQKVGMDGYRPGDNSYYCKQMICPSASSHPGEWHAVPHACDFGYNYFAMNASSDVMAGSFYGRPAPAQESTWPRIFAKAL